VRNCAPDATVPTFREGKIVFRRLFALVSLCLAIPLEALAQSPLGVIVLHGKQGTPTGNQGLSVIAANLQSAGHKVVVPAAPWGRGGWETINVTVEEALAQLDGYAAQLRAQGAGRIVVIGHSLGACVGLAYAVERGNLAGLVMLAPGHNPAGRYRNDKARAEVDRAHALVQQGKGNETMSGGDSNQGNNITMSVRAAVYWSWHNPNGLASMPAEAPRLPATTPLLLVIGEKDPSFARTEGMIYRPAAKHPYSKYVTNGANHFETPMAATKVVTDWVNGLPR
jgi:pimeloyl-ACP methyl ester carboxylesterase